MTSDAKRKLASTIRELRTYLLKSLHDAVESEYRFSIKRAQDADLDEARTARRRRFEAWNSEQVRAEAKTKKKSPRDADAFRLEAEKQAAYTLLNRLVFLRLLEECGLRKPKVVTGGWGSAGYGAFRELAPALVQGDPTEGYAFLLQLVFEDLAHDLPGLYGPAGIAELVPIGPAVLRRVVEALDDEALASCWTDDMTLGWVYQYWNDPEREALDAKLNSGGKVEPHEIASKTQMFTERYMVDWLLQNSLGPMWLAMCKKHGWTPVAESDGTLERLEQRRVDWREKRDNGAVELTDLMPLHTDMERRWAYYVPQPIPDDAVEQAPDSVRDLKILDPAVGSGHFLVVAFDLLLALYKEEAAHLGEADDTRWSERAVVESILERNLHGIDLDPRAVQIAAAALWLKAKQACPEAEPRTLNLVASDLNLASLPDNDPALVELRREVERETGIPAQLTDQVVHALGGADHLGSLLKIDVAVDDAIRAHEAELGLAKPDQGELFTKGGSRFGERQRVAVAIEEAKAGILDRLERFLDKHGAQDDLGLRLRGEQLARGIRFLRLLQEGRYDLVVGNPPYQGTSKMADSKYIEKRYPLGKADLFAAFMLRGLELVRAGGVSALLTMRNWMFIKQYAGLRQHLLETFHLRLLHDISSGGFEEISAAQVVVSVVSSVFARTPPESGSVALKSFDDDTVTQVAETMRKRAATLCHVGRHEFDPAALKVVPEWPLVYWWDESRISEFVRYPLLGSVAPARKGLDTGNNARFVRHVWEGADQERFLPFIQGGKSRVWFEPHIFSVNWTANGVELKIVAETTSGANIRNEQYYFRKGIAFSLIGSSFRARLHRVPSIIAGKGSSIYADDLAQLVCRLNSQRATCILEDLNPGIGFEIGDVNRLPLFPISNADEIVSVIETAFTEHERTRETSREFLKPAPSPWKSAQVWAQTAVDLGRLVEYQRECDAPPASEYLSFALGVSVGRFASDGGLAWDHSSALPAGILFLNNSLESGDLADGLGHSAAEPLHDAWAKYGSKVGAKRASLREFFAFDFFNAIHKPAYKNRPIHWPLSSSKRTFVAWINIHRWDENTLRFLLAEHLHKAETRLDGELNDLRAARDSTDKKTVGQAEKRYDQVLKWREELSDFIDLVTQCAEKGPPPADTKCPKREVDARYVPDLDDGVMINSAALWPLLEPQWKDPKKWWKQLASAKGKKHFDWSHLALRYWPTRVDGKCQEDPSLGVAHGCFWRYHPARAWAWELRLQDEIGPDFRIEEKPYDPPGLAKPTGDKGDAHHRAAYLRNHAAEALEAVKKEALRRRGRGKNVEVISEMTLLESGLWSALPEECWELELHIAEKQKADFRLHAPDEKEARAKFEKKSPKKVAARKALLAKFKPQQMELGSKEVG